MSEPGCKAPRWAWWIATGLGSGWMRPAPGTWGSLAGLAAWCIFTFAVTTPFVTWALRHPQTPLLPYSAAAMEILFLLTIALMTWIAVKASDRVVREAGLEDPGYIVADEWVGMWVTLWPLRWMVAQQAPRLLGPGGWRWLMPVAIAFVVFRIFDIWKPWPVHQIQILPEGQGVVADDLVAGLYGLCVMVLISPWISLWAAQP